MRPFLLLSLVVAFTNSCAQDRIDSRKQEIVFRSINVVPMDKELINNDQDVIIKNGRIRAIGNTGKIQYDKNALVIDAKGKYLIPGLAEMHAHVPPVDDLEPMKDVLLLFAVNGVTTIRGMLGHPRHLELRGKLQSGEITGPRFITSGPSFSGGSVKDVATAAKMVQDQKKAGYDFLKIHPGLTLSNFYAMVASAKNEKIPFAGHVPFSVGIWRAI